VSTPTPAQDDPLFTIIIPTRDRVDTLGRAVGGVLAQEERDWELVIVDDGSTDGTATYLATLTDPRIIVLVLDGRGVSAARNAGLQRATGRYVAFLDSDDEVLPGWLSALGELLQRGVSVASCAATVIDAADGSIEVRKPNPMPAPTLFLAGAFAVERPLLLAVGGYDEALNQAENTELGFRLIAECVYQGAQVMAVDEPLLVVHRDTRRASARPKYDAVLHLLNRHETTLRENVRVYSLFAAVAAVDAARDGEFGAARRVLAGAVRREPLYWRNVVRLLLCCLPPLARRVWVGRGDLSR